MPSAETPPTSGSACASPPTPLPTLAPMRWRLALHGQVESGGASHLGWAALDVVPRCAGTTRALAHVVTRFGLGRRDLLAGCFDAR